jgi:pilus assembly protein Flp/PilA
MVMRKHIAAFLKDRSAATALEYGLITALITLAILVGVTTAGTQMNTMLLNVGATLQASPAG